MIVVGKLKQLRIASDINTCKGRSNLSCQTGVRFPYQIKPGSPISILNLELNILTITLLLKLREPFLMKVK